MIRHLALCCLCMAVTGCADNSSRYLIDAPAASTKAKVRVATLEVRDVSLPAYAAALEIALQEEGGALHNLADTLWGDEPVRGVTGAIARNLDIATTATVAASPWPLEEPPQAQLDIRIERMLARDDATFELSGQYAIASPEGVIRERLERFDIRIPLVSTEPAGIVAATGLAIAELGKQVSRTLAR